MKITNKEYNQIIKELANRLRDMAYINAERNMEKELPKDCVERYLDKAGITEIIYSFNFLVDDLRQILGRARRKETKK